jgi:histone deacetylase complex regulatory component SIN3
MQTFLFFFLLLCRIRVHEVKDKVVNLFYGHDDVLLGFNMFLPEEHKIIIPVHNPASPLGPPLVQITDAMSFVNQIKASACLNLDLV